MRLANVTMHGQAQYLEAFKALGYVVNPEPLLRVCAGAEDAKAAACEALKAAEAQGAQGILLGGRTDVVIYAAILAAIGNFKVFVAETERVRDENDKFVFNLKGVTPVELFTMMERDERYIAVGVDGVPHAPAHYETPPDDLAMEHFRWCVMHEGLGGLTARRLGVARDNSRYRARLSGNAVEVYEERSGRVVGTLPAPKFEVFDSVWHGKAAVYGVGRAADGRFWFAWSTTDASWEQVVGASGAPKAATAVEDVTIGGLDQVVSALHAAMGALALNFHDSDEPDVVAGVKEMHARLQKALIARP